MRFSSAIAILAGLTLANAAPVEAVVQHAAASQVNVKVCQPHRGHYTHMRTYYDAFGSMQTVTEPGRPSTLEIHYVNTAHVAAKEIDFGLVAKSVLVAKVKDVGTFSNAVTIDHEFDIPHDVFPLGTGLPQCVPLKIIYADGTVWHNPNPPQP